MSSLEKLYYKIKEDYKDFAETEVALDVMVDSIGEENYLKYENKISAYAVAAERQGFIVGFQCAVSLLMNRN